MTRFPPGSDRVALSFSAASSHSSFAQPVPRPAATAPVKIHDVHDYFRKPERSREGHGLHNEENQFEFYGAMDEFLATDLEP